MPPRLPRPGPRHAVLILPARPGGVCFFSQTTAHYRVSPEQIRESLRQRPKSSLANRPNVPISYISFHPGPSNIPDAPRAVPSKHMACQVRAADRMVLYQAKGYKPQFLYSARHFFDLPRNTLVPEICLLGRSNVGKSTLINAIAGLSPSRTGTVNKTLARKGLNDGVSGLAVTSSKAGCTQTLNCYGFGPAPSVYVSGCERLEVDEGEDEDGGAAREVVGGRSRSQIREDAKERARQRETHMNSLYVVDMPGYGHNSREEWGNEILKYIQKRKMLKGAVLLIDATAGFKEGDRVTLRLLRDAGVRTAVILTKGNKATLAFDPAAHGVTDLSNDHPIVKCCAQIWEELRKTEREVPQTQWTEGEGWERGIFVTAAHNNPGEHTSNGSSFGLSGVRLALCNMAGLVVDAKASPIKPLTQNKPELPSRIVSFNDIMWAPTTLPAPDTTSATTSNTTRSTSSNTSSSTTSDPFETAFGALGSPVADVSRGKGRRKTKARAVTRKGSNDPFSWGDEKAQPAATKSGKRSNKSNKTNKTKPLERSASRGVTPLDSFDAAFYGTMNGFKLKSRKGRTSRASF